MARKTLKNWILTALFLALGIVLPFLTGQIPQIGKMLSPMHIPVMLCGLICGWPYGLALGLILPLLRSLLFQAPALIPGALAMAPELATYGAVIGLLFCAFRKRRNIGTLYFSLVVSMLAGRAVWGLARTALFYLLGADRAGFSLKVFWTSGFAQAVPAVILQLLLIPAVMIALDRAHLVPMRKEN